MHDGGGEVLLAPERYELWRGSGMLAGRWGHPSEDRGVAEGCGSREERYGTALLVAGRYP